MGLERSVKKSCQWQVFSDRRDSGTATCPCLVAEQVPSSAPNEEVKHIFA